MSRALSRFGLMTQFALLAFSLCAMLAVAAGLTARSLVVSQAINQSRAVADMAENIGKWASQYGVMWVHTKGLDPHKAGTYLERHLYAPDDATAQRLVGVSTQPDPLDLEALKQLDAFYSKNPALVQREVADVAAASPSGAKYRITARGVFNLANAPNAFERRALDAVQEGGKSEYIEEQGSQLLYARSIVAEKSCLRCHESAQTAPPFMLNNVSFSPGGFGYVAGKPAAVISVTVALPSTGHALAESISPAAWAALAGAAGALGLLAVFTVRGIIVPINRLRGYAERLANTSALQQGGLDLPDDVDEHSRNEIHRLTLAIAALGESVTILFRRPRR
jgi:hypothetical protein